jgi:hypothetical protein
MTLSMEPLPGAARRRFSELEPSRGGSCGMSPGHPGLAVERVRRDDGVCVLVFTGDLSRRSTGQASSVISAALTDMGRVLVDLSGVRLTWSPAAQLFPSTVTALGGWPRVRLVLCGADPDVARALTALRVPETVPLAPDQATGRRQLERRPPAVARYLDLDDSAASPRRARLFVKTACTDWELAAICEDAMLVAGELVGNVVAHARTSSRLQIRLDALGLTIEVRDYEYRGLLVPAVNAHSHRRDGLFLVAALSRAWGVSPTENGKSVWAVLPVPHSTSTPADVVAHENG